MTCHTHTHKHTQLAALQDHVRASDPSFSPPHRILDHKVWQKAPVLQLLHTALRFEHKGGVSNAAFFFLSFLARFLCYQHFVKLQSSLSLSLSRAAQVEDMSIKLQFNTYEKWTKALK